MYENGMASALNGRQSTQRANCGDAGGASNVGDATSA
jgi:hypothetical protein